MTPARLDELPDLLTVAEVTSVLRVSRNTVYDAIRSGQVPVVRFGRRVLIPKRGLVELMAGGVPGIPQPK